ncbi:MAG: hypothetical protein F4W92_09405 [Gammaproteobacteria bacterium]|nr:hypothetical protein [Gammaproteobacteria bacterium]
MTKLEVFSYLEGFHNPSRIHSAQYFRYPEVIEWRYAKEHGPIAIPKMNYPSKLMATPNLLTDELEEYFGVLRWNCDLLEINCNLSTHRLMDMGQVHKFSSIVEISRN